MNILMWASLVALPWQTTAADPLVSMLRQVVAEVEARYENAITLRLDTKARLGDRQSTEGQLTRMTAAARAVRRNLVDVSKELECPAERSSYEDCTLPDGLWALQVSSLTIDGDRAEMWFRLLFNSEGGGVRSPGFQATFERRADQLQAWQLRDIKLRIMP